MDRKIVMRRKGQTKTTVSHIEYSCRNPESGCNYKVESTVMAGAEMIPIREPLPDKKSPELPDAQPEAKGDQKDPEEVTAE